MLLHLIRIGFWSLIVSACHAIAWALLVVVGFFQLNMETITYVMSEMVVSLPFVLLGYGIYQARQWLIRREELAQRGPDGW